MRVGLMSLGDLVADPESGERRSQAARHQQIVDLAVTAEQAGFDSVWIGEHHFCDYIVSSPPVLLAAIAARTERLRLGTAVTLLPNLDPVRVAEDYATLDLVSDGRVELVVGRGIVPRVYDGFGQVADEGRAILAEHLDLLTRLWTEGEIDWSGNHRPAIEELRVEPHPLQQPHPPIWVGGGSTLESARLAADRGLGLMLPSVLAPPEAFLEQVDHYREHFAPAPGGPPAPVVGACSHVHVAPTGDGARRRWEPYHLAYMAWLRDLLDWGGLAGRTRPPSDFAELLAGPSICGSPGEVIDRLATIDERIGLDIHLAMFDHGGMPESLVTEVVECYGESVVPAVRADVRET